MYSFSIFLVYTKYYTSSYNAIVSPPIFLLRNLLKLQNIEKSKNIDSDYFPRDHIRHLSYLYLFGNFIYNNSRIFKRKINDELNFYKKKYQVTETTDNLFYECWLTFVLFHDISYPIERLSTDNKELQNEITKNIICDFINIEKNIKSDSYLRTITNLVSLLIINNDKETKTFEDEIQDLKLTDQKKDYFFTIKGEKAILSQQIKYLTRLVAAIIGNENIYVIIKRIDDSEIQFIGSCDTIIYSLGKRDYKKIAFSSDEEGLDAYYFKYYFCKNIEMTLREIYGTQTINSLNSLKDEIMKNEKIKWLLLNDNSNLVNICTIVFNIICDTEFINYNSSERVYQKDSSETINDIINRIGQDFPRIISEEIKKVLTHELEEKAWKPENIMKTSTGDTRYLKLLSNALEIDTLLEQRIEKEPDQRLYDFITENGRFVKIVNGIKKYIDPKIDYNMNLKESFSTAFTAMEKISSKDFDNICSKSKLLPVFKKMNDINSITTEEILSAIKESNELSFLLDSDFQDSISMTSLVNNYIPKKWKYDHGEYSSLVFLLCLEIDLLIQHSNEEQIEKMKKYSLTCSNKIREINHGIYKVIGKMCLRAILLHNYYPEYSKNDKLKLYRNDINKEPFTYFSILCDTLQDWDRDIQYNSGLKDIKNFKPETFMDFEIKDSIINVFINSRYFTEKDVIELRNNISNYLKSSDVLVKISLDNYFNNNTTFDE